MTRAIDESVLTAYALDECSPEERAEVEALLRRSPSARTLVEQLQELAAIAEEALVEEPSLSSEQRQSILDAADAREHSGVSVLAPMATPVLAAPPEPGDDKVVPLERKPRRKLIWGLRITAVAAVGLVALSTPLLYVANSPGRHAAHYDDYQMLKPKSDAFRRGGDSTASMIVSAESDPADPDVLRDTLEQGLHSELETPLHKPSDPGAAAYRSTTPTEGGVTTAERERDRSMELARRSMRESRQVNDPHGGEEQAEWSYTSDHRADRERRIEERKEQLAARRKAEQTTGERYNPISHNDYALVTDTPLSTFSIDVDTASYANVRRFLQHHTLPPASAVRIEELINYFDYSYSPPSGDAPFATQVEIASCPWNPEHRLARIGLKGKVIDEGELPPSNLVFLLDVSGSMSAQNKLPLVQQAIRLLVHELDERDRVAIVVYAGSSGLALPATSGEDSDAILGALERLNAGGSTAGGAGIELAYQTAVANFVEGGINRVILATDGDFNVGLRDQGALLELIEDRAKSGVFLTVLGFGMGNLQDGTLEQLADHGNGNYAYIDDLDEARKVLVTERGGTMATIAKDVKIQVEFNPKQVHAYRLIGYENRALAARDFDDDSKDAGEIGAGHTVTALYEVVPAGTDLAVSGAPILKYQQPTATTQAAASGELMTVKLRYKQPDGDRSQLLSFPVTDGGTAWSSASRDFRHAAAVAAFGMLLRDSPHRGEATWAMVQELAAQGVARDPHGYRSEFATLARKAQELTGE